MLANRPDRAPPTAPPRGRALLLDLYRTGLAAVDGRTAVARAARDRPPVETAVIALGKAALAMLDGAVDVLGSRCRQAFVVTSRAALDGVRPRPGVAMYAGDHPVPGAASLAAGAALEAFVAALPPRQPVWVLVSGGASSLVESLVPGATAEDLVQLNRWALAHDVPIGALNALRPRLSRWKGGGLAAALGTRPAAAFVLSDVPGDDPGRVGSGPVTAMTHWPALPPGLPPALAARLASLPAMPRANVPATVVGSLDDALNAVEARARVLGWRVLRRAERVDGAAAAAGETLAREWLAADADVLVAGGETTVELPPVPGVGGRCQHLALAAARVLAGQPDILLLAAGTDGVDGASPDAGAVVDGATVARAADAGVDAADCLRRADAGRCLESSGDLLHTGPTGTNVGDLLVALKGTAAREMRGEL